jgi:hypothetical protein
MARSLRGRNLRKTLPILALFFCAPAFAQESLYIGAEACRSCHTKAFNVWTASLHSRAQALLPPENQQTLRCLFCHSTDAQRNLKNYRFADVQCEACHGPGGRHVALAAQQGEKSEKPGGLEAVSEKTCLRCHTDVRSTKLRPFDLEAAKALIRHW